MFGTWKYDPETDEVQNLRQAFDPVTARSSQHQACNRCHEKKLKCSGEKGGCERCVINELECEYTRSSSRGSRRSKKTRRRSGESTGRDDSPASTRTISARGSHSGNLTPRQGGSPLPISTAIPGAASTASQVPPQMIDQLDFSLLMPHGAFDPSSLSQSDHLGYVSSPTAIATTAAETSAYAVPVTHSPVSMSPTFHQHQFPHQQDPSAFHDSWLQSHHAQGFHPDTSSPPPAHSNSATAGQGFPGTHQDNYHAHQHHSQGFHDIRYWGGGV